MIKISNLTFQYSENGPLIFDNASMKIKKGLWLLEGENGSGKSTLLKLIASSKTEGNAMDLIEYDGFIESEEVVFIDNQLTLPLQLSEEILVNYLLKINGITLKKLHKPIYRNTPLFQYSDGEQKMVVFRLLSYLNPRILLLDEYVSNLDEAHLTEVFSLLKDMSNNGSTILCSSNELAIKKQFQNKVRILKGKLVINDE